MRNFKTNPTANGVPATAQTVERDWPINQSPTSRLANSSRDQIVFNGKRRFCLHLWLALSALLASVISVYSEDEIELNNQTTTFTNLHGKVYEDVQLERATHDGLIYTTTNTGSIGMVRYSDLPTNFLAGLKIPDSLVTEATERQKALALEKQRYDEANRQLELQQETNSAAQYAAAQAQAQAAAAKQNATPPSQAQVKPARTEIKHHRRRR